MDNESQIAEKRRVRAEKKAEKQAQAANVESDPTIPLRKPGNGSEKTRKAYKPRESKSVVHRAPPTGQQVTASIHQNGKSIKIMTWNILAQCLVRRTLFPGSDCLKWKDRGPAITQEIVDYNPDVVCLQEVDRLEDHKAVLSAAGYEVLHVIGGYEEEGKQHGLLIGWKDDLLNLIDQKVIRFDEQEFKSRVGLSRATRNVALIAGLAFKHHPGGLVIGTAHLFWHSRYSYERTRQTAFLAKALAEFRSEDRDTTNWPVFLAGDLNEQPGGPSYRLLSGAALPEKEQLILKESALIHKSADRLFTNIADETYVTFEGDEDRVFKDVRPSRPEDGLFDLQELEELFGSRRWLSLYGNWADKMINEEGNWFKDRPEFKDPGQNGKLVPCLDQLGSGQYEPMWTNFTPLWRCTLDYIWVLCTGASSTSAIEVLALLPTHRTEALEPGLPRLGVEPSDHIPLMAEVMIPCL
ncbi:hypothetical protein PTTG_05986 [Puccinia triticina 1-1 BBBD Race 1]|uniref:Endo/exonuclease/phosphatase domain-containing protein n=2 Tax=Puccinia triticina TaxID=208348 RepID=A0A180GAS1_PUCT1|nr:uncharacterized protein PtA15_3A656 [Puccinia triticina]OAV89432.1 hypothetical protein PTTG_05986 [Puccinia triticina 1-1 BBBD Race 1]WAQ83287.1 hypothetical protein PtA15_3A656 [Puccinia triticina]WAR54135.1 hypothetical protein PtB15_3B647 [Puccinia triticina]